MGRIMAVAIHVATATNAMAIIIGGMAIIATGRAVVAGVVTIEWLCRLTIRQLIGEKVR